MPGFKSEKPDSLIAPNSNVRGKGGKGGKGCCDCSKKGKGIVIDNKTSAKDGLSRIKSAPGWGSNAGNNYDPSPPAFPNF